MATAREHRRVDTVEAVTRAALSLFEQQGYDSTRVSDVAVLAGVSRRTVFRHFAGKDDLLRGVHDRWLRVFADNLAPGAPGTSVRESIEPAIVAIADDVLADPHSVHRVHRLIEEVPTLQAAWVRYEHEWREAFVEILEREHQMGAHLGQVVAAAMAANLVSALGSWSRRPERVGLRELIAQGFDAIDDSEPRETPSP